MLKKILQLLNMPALAAVVFSFSGHGNQALCSKHSDNMNQTPYTNYVYEASTINILGHREHLVFCK